MSIISIAKKLTGIQAFEDRKEAQLTKERAEERYHEARERTEQLRAALNDRINDFGRVRLESVDQTVKRFVLYLKDLSQKSKTGGYELLDSIEIRREQVKELQDLEMSASQMLKGAVTASALGAVALSGVPAAVTTAVTTLATASTGTAISTLSGAAASNAVLAWLGGGSLAAGGGGVAAGAATLSALTWTATGGVAMLTAGLIASAHYSKKLTEAKEYEEKVATAVGEMEKAWVVMGGIDARICELMSVTEELSERAVQELKYLAPLVPDFDTEDGYQLRVFQKCGLLVKAIGELARTPIFDDAGDISEDSGIVIKNVQALLST